MGSSQSDSMGLDDLDQPKGSVVPLLCSNLIKHKFMEEYIHVSSTRQMLEADFRVILISCAQSSPCLM